MDTLQNGRLVDPNLEPETVGRLRSVPGKIGNAVQLPGAGPYIDVGSFTDSCVGNTSVCMYGLTAAFWLNIVTLKDNMFFMASGHYGFSIFSYSDRLYASVQFDDRQWQTSASGIRTGIWYFVEVTWNPISGLEIYLDQQMKASQRSSTHNQIQYSRNKDRYQNFYIGRAHTDMSGEKYAAAIFDDIYIYNAERERLISLGLLQRGKTYVVQEFDGSFLLSYTSVLTIKTCQTVVICQDFNGNNLQHFS